MSSLKKGSRSASLVRLVLVLALTVLALQVSSTSSAATGLNNCAQFCESLCDYQRFQCYDFCDMQHPPGSQALDDCYWNCSIQGGACRDNCLGHCR
jgi:hypothetical protein